MSIYPLARVWDHSQQRGTPLLILLAMADRADELGVVWAGTSWLASRARVNRRQIVRSVHYLEAGGELIVMRSKKTNGQPVVNHYIVAVGASDDTISQARQRVAELLDLRGSVLEDTTPSVPQDTRVVTPATGGVVTPGHWGSDTRSHDPSSYPLEKESDPPPISALELWRRVLDELEMQTSRRTFSEWLRGTTAAWAGSELIIQCRNEFAVDWLQSRLRDLIERAVTSAGGSPYPIRFEVTP